jgi:hypothetical protein
VKGGVDFQMTDSEVQSNKKRKVDESVESAFEYLENVSINLCNTT